MSNLIWLNTKVKILINRVNELAEVHSLINSNIKRFSITKQEIGPFYSDNGSLTNDKTLIYKLLLKQFNSAFSIPLSKKL